MNQSKRFVITVGSLCYFCVKTKAQPWKASTGLYVHLVNSWSSLESSNFSDWIYKKIKYKFYLLIAGLNNNFKNNLHSI